jgi:hypothetical protein
MTLRLDTVLGGSGAPVLEDPSGRRARWMRRAGRLVFVVFLGWLLAIVLGGLGLMPVAGIPLADVLRPSQGPPPLAQPPARRQPSVSDLRPAVPAELFAARTAKTARNESRSSGASQGKSTVERGHAKTTPGAAASNGKSTTAPGRIKKTTTVTTASGKSTEAHGHAKTTTKTTVGRPKKP